MYAEKALAHIRLRCWNNQPPKVKEDHKDWQPRRSSPWGITKRRPKKKHLMIPYNLRKCYQMRLPQWFPKTKRGTEKPSTRRQATWRSFYMTKNLKESCRMKPVLLRLFKVFLQSGIRPLKSEILKPNASSCTSSACTPTVTQSSRNLATLEITSVSTQDRDLSHVVSATKHSPRVGTWVDISRMFISRSGKTTVWMNKWRHLQTSKCKPLKKRVEMLAIALRNPRRMTN